MRPVTVLGATGSVGVNALDVIQQHPDRFQVFALSAHQNMHKLAEQCKVYRPKFAVIKGVEEGRALKARLDQMSVQTEVLIGESGLREIAAAAEVDTVVAAIVGAAGLPATLAAVQAGKTVLLANKEALVMGGAWLMQQVEINRATLLPIDSEHNAIFQCLPMEQVADCAKMVVSTKGINKLWLTASGGPFREYTFQQLEQVTPVQACAHPVWAMGSKISVDSATLMNKGLELIEACLLFQLPCEQIEVVVHPDGIVHSLVEYVDGSVLAQMATADMRVPIAHALAWPERCSSGVDPLDVFGLQLGFERPKSLLFPCLGLAKQAFRAGGSAVIVLNAANEVAVEAFLNHRIKFTEIPAVIEATLDTVDQSLGGAFEYATIGNSGRDQWSIEAILEEDRKARTCAYQQINLLSHKRISVSWN